MNLVRFDHIKLYHSVIVLLVTETKHGEMHSRSQTKAYHCFFQAYLITMSMLAVYFDRKLIGTSTNLIIGLVNN